MLQPLLTLLQKPQPVSSPTNCLAQRTLRDGGGRGEKVLRLEKSEWTTLHDTSVNFLGLGHQGSQSLELGHVLVCAYLYMREGRETRCTVSEQVMSFNYLGEGRDCENNSF